MHLLSVFSLKNRALIALITIVIGVFGGISLTSLKQELIPSLSLPQLFVVATYPGASPTVVDADVSAPIEQAVQSVEGLESTTASSSANVSTVTASFAYGTNLETAEQKVQSAINRIQGLPESVDPQVLTFSISDLPVIQIAVTSDLDQRELSTRLEESTLTELNKLEGVAETSLLGTTSQRVDIRPDPAQLAALGLSNQAITDALDANGVLLPAGEITEDGQTLSVQAGARLSTVDDIAALPLLGGQDAATIGDVAEVSLADEPVTGISRVDGQPSLTVAITKTPAGNTVAVSQAVQDALPGLEDALGSGTEFTVVFDQAPFIEQSIESLATEGVLGLVFAVIVILVFLLSIRSTLVTAISIPASVLITFIGMQASGYTLNIITLGALTISVGRVVDDSIVVIENIKRHLALGESKLHAISTAVREVAGAITASTVTTVAVFLPLALVSDITGELFRPFALTVTIALAASLFVSLTIVPVLAYWFLKAKTTREQGRAAGENVDTAMLHMPLTRRARREGAAPEADELATPTRLQKVYLPVIRWSLRKPFVTLLLALLVLGGTGALAPLMKTNFIGDTGQNTLTVTQELPLGASLEAQDDAARQVEDELLAIDGVETVQLSLGSGSSTLQSAFGGGSASFSLVTDESADQEELQQRVRDAVGGLGDDAGDITVSAAAGGGGFGGSDIEIDVTAPDENALREGTQALVDRMTSLDVAAQVTSNLSEQQPYIEIAVDRAAAASAGLSEVAVGGIVTAAMNPSAVGETEIDDTTLSIYVVNDGAPTTLDELRAFAIPTAGGPVPLSDLAAVEEVDAPSTITTVQGQRSATVTITPSSDDIGTASASVGSELESVDLPAGVSAEIGGVASDQEDAFIQLGLALLVAILIVYVVMVATFKSLIQPLLLLVSVPFAATGVIVLQVITDTPLGVSSVIGALMLVGVVVTNAIVLVDLINQYRARGSGSVADAIVHGAARRLRPILMTAAATIFALLPLAIGITGHGGFISQPLAIVVIGGLVSSTLLTLVVLPALYYVWEGRKERGVVRRARRAERRERRAERREARRERKAAKAG